MKLWLLLLLCACESPLKDTLVIHTIKRGHNYSRIPVLSPIKGANLRFDAKFGDVWHPADSSVQKLYGFTDCWSSVHENSLRFGWKPASIFPFIDIFAYWYIDGKMYNKWLGQTVPWRTDEYELTVGNDYGFRFNNKVFITKRDKNCDRGPRARLFPNYEDMYGRGAPKDLTIYIYEW